MQATLVHHARSTHVRPRRPRLLAPDDEASAGQASDAARRGAASDAVLRILVVDDDPLMTDLLPRKLMRGIAFPRPVVLTASTPEDGLRLARSERPDVVLSDFNLRATMTGLDVLAEVARVQPGAVRILFSAHTREEVGPGLEGAAIHGFVEKTMRLEEMLGPLVDVLRRSGLDVQRPEGGR